MNIIIDSNILFSALIKDSVTRKIILEYNGCFLFPYIIFEEMEEHKEELLEKTGLEKEEFDNLLNLILKKVIIVPKEVLKKYKKEALEIVKDIDVDDFIFVACALAYDNSLIWTKDRRLKEQDKVRIYNTKEIIKLLDITF